MSLHGTQTQARTALLKQRARFMRHNPTHSEALLWGYLKGSRLGVAFRRQVVLREYVVDFLAPAVKLVVEIDGGYHAGCVRLDAVREARLTRAGYRVVRVSHELVVRDAQEAVRVIASWL